MLSRDPPCWRGNPEHQSAECTPPKPPRTQGPLPDGARSCKSVESEVHRSPGGTLRELALVALGSLLVPAFRKPLPRRKRAPGSFSVASEPVFSRCMLGGVLQDRCGCILQLCALSAFRGLSRSALVQLEVFLCALRGCWSKSRAWFRGCRPRVTASRCRPTGHGPCRMASMQ